MGRIRAYSLIVLAALPCAARASGAQRRREPFPPAQELFERLLAAPREIKTTARYYRREGDDLADGSLGNVWGLWRWHADDPESWRWQLNLGGMAYSRFRLSGGVNELQTTDFFLEVPLEARRGRLSTRASLFHESSHLGDDYIRRTKDTGFRYSIDGASALLSIEPVERVRLYGGGSVLLHGVPSGQSGGIEAGFELRSRTLRMPDHDTWVYLAQHFLWHQRVEMNLHGRTELGLRLGVPRVARALRTFVGYQSGRSPFGQFYTRNEGHFDLGVTLDF